MLSMQYRSRQGGFSLVELMVGMVVGLLVIAGAGTVYISTLRGSTESIQMTKVNQELRSIMAVMTSDIRRTGYWSGVAPGTPGVPPPANPFSTAGATSLTIHDFDTGTANCIMYAYDATYRGTSTPGVLENTDVFGFRLNGTDIQMPTALPAPPATTDCTAGTWQTANDDRTMEITELSFNTFGSQCSNSSRPDLAPWRVTDVDAVVAACDCTDVTICPAFPAADPPVSGDVLVEMPQINITLSGRHLADNTVTMALTEQVKVRNNRIVIVP